MKLLLDANGNVVVRNDKPVYVLDNGREIEFDAVSTTNTIAPLRTEGGDLKKKVEGLQAVADSVKDMDMAAAKKALEIVKNLDDKKLVDAGEVDKVKNEAIKAVEEKYKPTVERVKALEGELYGEKVGGAFARSRFIAEKLAIPADMVEARFRGNFTLENGKVTAKDASGNLLYSKSNPGVPAEFDEALELLVEAYPQKSHILKGTGSSGGGSQQQGQRGGQPNGKVTMSRTAYEALGADDRAAKTADLRTGKLVLQDSPP